MKIVFLSKRHFLKTKSDQFLIDLLNEIAHVVVLRREDHSSWKLYRLIAQERPDALIFFATPPSFFHHILRFPFTRKIFVPMYDGFKPFKPLKEKLFRFFKLKALCFSQPTYDYLTKLGLKTLSARFFPKPTVKKTPTTTGPYTFFFWQRNKDVTLSLVRSVIGDENIKKIYYRVDPEFEEKGPAIEKVTGWLEVDTLKDLLQSVDFVIAPRVQEGIGMAFLDALAAGTPVIAYDDHTMSDYITPGVNGYLFKKERITLSPPGDLTQQNKKFFERWLEDRHKIKVFIRGRKGRIQL